MSSAGSVGLVNEAVGSGVGNGRRSQYDYGRGAGRRVSAEVPAREEGRRSRIYDHVVEQEGWFESIRLGRNRRQVLQPSIVEGHLPPPSC